MSRDIAAAAERLANATPEELQTIARHDWDMIREVAAMCLAHQRGSVPASDQQIKSMVDRFLGWRLPESFHPDCGITFDKSKIHPSSWPTGTNLIDASQATAMVRHMLELPPAV